MKDLVHARELYALRQLLAEDGALFECLIEEHASYDARKLHEVRVNPRLANHLETALLPVLRIDERLFVDIEFNREDVDFKHIRMNGENHTVTPDIIIHNRKTGSQKRNVLAVECKKQSAHARDIEEDQKKILSTDATAAQRTLPKPWGNVRSAGFRRDESRVALAAQWPISPGEHGASCCTCRCGRSAVPMATAPGAS